MSCVREKGQGFTRSLSTSVVLPLMGILCGLAPGFFHLVDWNRAAIFAVAGAIAGLGAAVYRLRGATLAADRLAKAMRRMAEGDRTIDLPAVDRSDQIGQIARACEICRNSVAEAARLRAENERLREACEAERRKVLLKSLDGIVGAGMRSSEAVIRLGHMSADIGEANSRLQAMAASIEELQVSVQAIAASSEGAADESRVADAASSAGRASSQGATHAMERIVTSVQAATREVDELAKVSLQIGDFVAQINDIAAKTNLLALNATIEAARAGEAGKGFAVVATEVKSLATQAGRAADDIAKRIEALRARTEGIVGSMQQGVAAVGEGRGVIDELGVKLEDVADRVSTVTARMTEIAGILSQQNAAATNVAEGTAAVATVSESNMQSITALLDDMDAMATNLDAQIGSFADLGGAAIVEIAKNDHIAFKRRIVDAVLGRSDLKADQLADHLHCRLGHWYAAVKDPVICNSAAFKALLEPHQRVHRAGVEALKRAQAGDRRGALKEVEALSDASQEVVRQLDALVKLLQEQEAAAAKAA